jgi:putative DNA primase/helicase
MSPPASCVRRLLPTAARLTAGAWGRRVKSAIKLWADAEVTNGIVVGEGMETTACAATLIEHQGTRLAPAWALVDAGNLANFPLLTAVEYLTILVDADHADQRGRRAGQASADACTRRWLEAGAGVTQLVPNIEGADFADLAQQEAPR